MMSWKEIIPYVGGRGLPNDIVIWSIDKKTNRLEVCISLGRDVLRSLDAIVGDSVQIFKGTFKDRELMRLRKITPKEQGFRIRHSGHRGLISIRARKLGVHDQHAPTIISKWQIEKDGALVFGMPNWIPRED